MSEITLEPVGLLDAEGRYWAEKMPGAGTTLAFTRGIPTSPASATSQSDTLQASYSQPNFQNAMDDLLKCFTEVGSSSTYCVCNCESN